MPLEFVKPAALNGNNLAEEIQREGFTDVLVVMSREDVITISGYGPSLAPLAESDRSVLQAIIDAHTGELTDQELRPFQVRDKIEQRIGQAENAYAKWSTLTNAQKDAALREVVLAVAKLGRLALHRFDVDET